MLDLEKEVPQMAGKQVNRREFLRLTATAGLGVLLAACGGTAAPQGGAAPTAAGGEAAAPTAAPAAGGGAAPTSAAPPALSQDANVIDWWHGWGGQGAKALEEA